MKPRDEPITDPPPIDRAKVHALLDTAAADRDRGETMHQHPALMELSDLAGVMAYYAAQYALDGREDLDALADHIVRHAAAWKSQATRG